MGGGEGNEAPLTTKTKQKKHNTNKMTFKKQLNHVSYC